jgi:DinB family protein
VTEPCGECGFDYDAISVNEGIEKLRSLPRRYRAPLTRFLPGEDGDAVVRQRPGATTWSALEYAAHMRDVVMFWNWALKKVFNEDAPVLPPPNEDELDGVAAGYAALDPVTVADELAANVERMVARAEGAAEASWDRAGDFGGIPMTALDIVRKVDHEGHHHLLDIGRGLRAVREARSAAAPL